MSRSITPNFSTLNIIAPIFLILFLCIGFVPNLQAVDKIAPQWLVMSLINLLSIIYFLYNKKTIGRGLELNLNSKLTIIYILFILWCIGSILYAINPTEVIVNLARQVNVFLMFFCMVIFFHGLKNKLFLIPWVITLILIAEVYAVLSEAIEMIKTVGSIDSGNLKGVTANRNIAAFSLAIKIPFTLFLIQQEKKTLKKVLLAILICATITSLSMIQSRASFIALGFILLTYSVMQIVIYFKINKKLNQILQMGFLIIPLIISILINQTFLSSKGADAISRAATISVSTNDGSVNQRIRYYEDVLTHVTSNPIFGVGLGNWKLKSIDYDSPDINGYIVPYHAHSDFIQLGAELGVLGFFLYLGIFLIALYYVFRLIRFSNLILNEKIFLFLTLIALGVYSVDANLNFPIARPQVLVVWALIMSIITCFYQSQYYKNPLKKKKSKSNGGFLIISFIILIPTIYINNTVFKSLKGQMYLLQDFNSNQFNLPLNQVDYIVPDIPNITVTTIPINSVKARYYVNAKKYDKALQLLNRGTKANPYLFYSEMLKSQIFEEKGQLDSAKFYAKKAFFGLPNNDLHSSRYINLISKTKDREALDDAFAILTLNDKPNNWKNYLIIASSLYPPGNKDLIKKALTAKNKFNYDNEFEGIYRQISIGSINVNLATNFSNKGLEYFNKQDYYSAAIEFEKAIEANPLDYAFYENAATSNYMIGNFDRALEQIDKVIFDLNPLNGKCEYIKALIFIRMGDPIGACPLIETSDNRGFYQAKEIFNQYCR